MSMQRNLEKWNNMHLQYVSGLRVKSEISRDTTLTVNMIRTNEDVGHGALTRFLLEIFLNLVSVETLIIKPINVHLNISYVYRLDM